MSINFKFDIISFIIALLITIITHFGLSSYDNRKKKTKLYY